MWSSLSCYTYIKIFTASSGGQQGSIDNAFHCPIPERILIALVKNTAFVGSASTNSFHFHHYDMSNILLYVSGVQHPTEPLKMDCSSPFGATRAYEMSFSSTGIHHDVLAHMITLEMFTEDLYFPGFNLTPDRKADEEHINIPLKEMCALSHALINHYQNQSPAFCMLNSLDTLTSTT